MKLNVLGHFDTDGEWLRKYLEVKRPGVLKAMERLGSDTITIKSFALPRMLITFGFNNNDLADDELTSFDRQVDHDEAAVVLDWMFHDFNPMRPAYDPDKCEFVEDFRIAGEGMPDEFEDPEDPIAGQADKFSEPVEPDRFS